MNRIYWLGQVVVAVALSICPLAGQTPGHPNGVTARYLFIDHYTPNIADNAAKHRITGGIEIGYVRNTSWKYLNVAVPVKLAVARYPETLKEVRFTSVDLLVQGILFDSFRIINPYIFAGGGVVFQNYKESNTQFPLGLGTHIRIASGLYTNLQGEYRVSMAQKRDNIQLAFGFMYIPGLTKKVKPIDTDSDGVPDIDDKCPLIVGLVEWDGCPDTDGDGIPDHLDQCPDAPGPHETQGCPDRDGDGVPDEKDACPDDAGLKLLDGCPDRDGDGIPDKDDRCPDEVGSALFAGCPPNKNEPAEEKEARDRDGDGVPDHLDLCPDEFGLVALGGCPEPEKQDITPTVPTVTPILQPNETEPKKDMEIMEPTPVPVYGDRDGDGVPDNIDKCPDSPGPASNEGCPVITQEERTVLDLAMRSIQFETGSATIMPDSYRTLDKISELMLKYKDYNLIINGHTDNVGRPQTNLLLSEQRAKACYNYLVSRGIDSKRMLHSGFGDNRPLTSNKTEEGRLLNRRVEFIMYLR